MSHRCGTHAKHVLSRQRQESKKRMFKSRSYGRCQIQGSDWLDPGAMIGQCSLWPPQEFRKCMWRKIPNIVMEVGARAYNDYLI